VTGWGRQKRPRKEDVQNIGAAQASEPTKPGTITEKTVKKKRQKTHVRESTHQRTRWEQWHGRDNPHPDGQVLTKGEKKT